MSETLEWAFFIAVVVGVVVAAVFAYQRYQRARAGAWRALADQLGLAHRRDAQDIHATLPHLAFFDAGEGTYHNVLQGEVRGLRVLIVDYTAPWRRPPGTEPASDLTVVPKSLMGMSFCLLSGDVSLPHFVLCPQGGWLELLGKLAGGQMPDKARFGDLIGAPDTTYEEDPEFSKRFVLRGVDAAATRAAFSAEVRARFTEIARAGLYCEGRDGDLLYYTDEPLDAEALPGFFAEAAGIFETLQANLEALAEG